MLAVAEKQKSIAICGKCRREDKCATLKSGEPGLPREWKRSRDTDEPVCRACWTEMYGTSPRAVTMPIRTVIGVGDEKVAWRDFAYLCACYGAKTAELMTWMYRWLLAQDPVLTASDQKLGKMVQKVDGKDKSLLTRLYQVGRPMFPDIDSKQFSALSKQVYGKYGKARLQILRAERWDRGYANPQPIPMSRDAHWKNIRKTEDGRYMVDVRIGYESALEKNDKLVLAGKWITVVLAGGRDYWRPLASVQKMIDGSAVPVEFAIIRKPGSDDNRATVSASDGGRKSFDRLELKMVAWMPRQDRDATLSGRYFVRTARNTFLVARQDGSERNDPQFIIHADNLRDAALVHNLHAMRKRQDWKTERRFGPRRRSRVTIHRVEHMENRLKTFCQQVAAMLVKRAERLRVADIVYDDSETAYMGSFVYYQLKEAIAQRLAPGQRLVLMDEWRREAAAIKDEKERQKAESEWMGAAATLKAALEQTEIKPADAGNDSSGETRSL